MGTIADCAAAHPARRVSEFIAFTVRTTTRVGSKAINDPVLKEKGVKIMNETAIEGVLFSIRPAEPSPIVDSGEPELFLLSAFYVPVGNGNGPYVKLEGISANITKVYVSVRLDGAEVTPPTEVQPGPNDGHWISQQQLPAKSGILAVYIRDDADVANESAIVQLPPLLAPIPAGSLLNLSDEITQLLAGSSDRLIQTRSFSLIEHRLYPQFIGDIFRGDKVEEIIITSQETVHKQIRTGRVQLQQVLDALDTTVRQEMNSQLRTNQDIWRTILRRADEPMQKIFVEEDISDGNKELLRQHRFGGMDYDPGSKTLTVVLPRLDKRLLPREYSLAPMSMPTMTNAANGLIGAAKIWIFAQPSRLGICFDEFLRFRTAGLVRGEPIYSLAMDAGEEVQLKQTSETVRSETYEEVLDLESEQSLTLSSTWSTDVSVAFNQSNTATSDWNVGGAAGFTGAPKLPLNLGVSSGISANNAAQNSIGTTVQNAYELSRQAMARLRAQHKTRMEVQDQTSIGISSIRSLNNRGAVRPRRVDFFKMYRKERATYERHDARLCLKLLVDDPAQIVRAEYERSLDAIDPTNEQHYEHLSSPPESIEAVAENLPWRPNQPMRDLTFGGMYAIEHLQVDLKGSSEPEIPDNYILVRKPQVKMSKVIYYWKQNYWDEGDYTTDHTHSEENDALVETSPGIQVLAHFDNYYGYLTWSAAPMINSPVGTGHLELKYRNHSSIISGGIVRMVETRLEITSKWAPPNDELTSFQQQRNDISDQLHDELTADEILHMRDIAVADYRDSVLAQAMRTHLSAGEPEFQVNPHDFHEWFAIEDAYVENAPYWATQEGMDRYQTMRSRLSGLNLGIPLSDILIPELTAAQSVLYLPIRPGAEENALALLPEYSNADEHIQNVIADFREYHEKAFGTTQGAQPDNLPSHEEISSPDALVGTPLGEPDWKTTWEPTQRKFQVVAQWADYVPTDGVDAQTVLSTTSKADEAVLRGAAEDTRYLD